VCEPPAETLAQAAGEAVTDTAAGAPRLAVLPTPSWPLSPLPVKGGEGAGMRDGAAPGSGRSAAAGSRPRAHPSSTLCSRARA
jgi:hypothetical protein